MKLARVVLTIAVLLAAAVGATNPTAAQTEFYSGKRINLIIGFTSGGGVDTYGRLLARHLSRHIPGNPEIVPQNMPGAAGLTALRALEATQPKDGTVIATFTPGIVVQGIVTPEQTKLDFSTFSWIGSFGQDERLCFMWGATGVKSWNDLVQKDQVVMGDTGGGGQSIIAQRMLKKLFGIRIKSILGYPGNAEKRLAIERGELDGDCSAVATLPADWLRDGKIHPLVRLQQEASSAVSRNVPYVGDLLGGDRSKTQLLELLNAASDIGRPFLVSKEVPAARVEILRAAFERTMSDPQFLVDAEKMKLDVTPTSGEVLQQRLRQLYATPPEVLASAREVLSE